MSRFRMVSVGEEQEVGFVCRRCSFSKDEPSFDTYNRPFQVHIHREGHCITCGGTGFAPGLSARRCPECHGTGACPVCGGLASRDSETLPGDELEEWRIAVDANQEHLLPDHYPIAASLYRKW